MDLSIEMLRVAFMLLRGPAVLRDASSCCLSVESCVGPTQPLTKVASQRCSFFSRWPRCAAPYFTASQIALLTSTFTESVNLKKLGPQMGVPGSKVDSPR